MAIKARGQIGLTDVTDAYSPNLSLDSFTFQGDTTKVKSTQTFSVVVSALQGDSAVTAAVDTSTISLPTGLTVSSDNDPISPTLTFTATTSLTDAILRTFGGVIDIEILVNGEATFHKSVAISIALTGATGTYATSVVVGNESVSIPCDKDGKTSAATAITIPFAGYYGTSRRACTIAASGLPTGITAGTNTGATTSADGSLTLNVASGSTLGGSASGEITLTLTCNSQTFVKKFSWAKAVTGQTGQTGGAGTSATSVVCGNEAVSIPCTLGGLVSAAQTITIPFAGFIGTTRAACSVTYSTLPSGITLNKNTAGTASADGSLVFNVAKDGTLGAAATLTGEITLTFTCNSQTFTKKFTWSKAMTGATGAKGDKGDQGAAGDDAIQLVIIPSAGTTFKNNTGSNVLTAHVFVGGTEVTGSALAALGTIKWYKGDDYLTGKDGTSLTVSAADVTNSETYEARLEA